SSETPSASGTGSNFCKGWLSTWLDCCHHTNAAATAAKITRVIRCSTIDGVLLPVLLSTDIAYTTRNLVKQKRLMKRLTEGVSEAISVETRKINLVASS